jgi:hypothetical protein
VFRYFHDANTSIQQLHRDWYEAGEKCGIFVSMGHYEQLGVTDAVSFVQVPIRIVRGFSPWTV